MDIAESSLNYPESDGEDGLDLDIERRMELPHVFPTLSGNALAGGNAVIGGGIIPKLSLGGMVNGGNNGYGIGVSATVGAGGIVLPEVAAGGGIAGAINQLMANVAGSAMASEGGWLHGFVPTASAHISAGGQAGLLVKNGLHAIFGLNGNGQGSLGYGGNFIPSSSLVGNIGGNIGFGINNAQHMPTESPTPTPTS
ncbi:hypothetical protein FB639_004776 [Coemansia asiatica]|nr:hypothetical protein FB639_004776 [Coemansia asiatica]